MNRDSVISRIAQRLQMKDRPPQDPTKCPECQGGGFSVQGPEGQYDECRTCTPKSAPQPDQHRQAQAEAAPAMDYADEGHQDIHIIGTAEDGITMLLNGQVVHQTSPGQADIAAILNWIKTRIT